jgi:molybdopterin molybdotransferase
MGEFFRVRSPSELLAEMDRFASTGEEVVPLEEALDRVLSRDVLCPHDLPPFARATMDGYAVKASDTFGASESLPALLQVVGEVPMGEEPDFSMGAGEAARIATGGMLPSGADAVVMVEHTQVVDESTVEIYKSVAPGEHMVSKGEEARAGERILPEGWVLRPQDVGLLAALGMDRVWVHRRPLVAILSTGDEVVPVEVVPPPGKVRDVNSYCLGALVRRWGGIPVHLGIVPDSPQELEARCREGLERADFLLLSGGSSVGSRDYALKVILSLDGSEILAHGVAIKPGKPTLLASVGGKPVLGLPGHPVSASIVFAVVGRPLLDRLSGRRFAHRPRPIPARLARNLASAQGREDYVRVTLEERDGELWAKPVLGASGLIATLVRAEGVIRIDAQAEGLERGSLVEVEWWG